MGQQGLERARRKLLSQRALRRRERFEKMLRQERYVPAPLAQRRKPELEHVEPEVQVRTKLLLPHKRREVTIACRNDAHICANEALRAQRAVCAVLQEAQQLGLGGKRQRVDFIQEKRAAVGQRREALLIAVRVRIGSPRMAEEFVFGQQVRHRAALHRDKRKISALAQVMDGVRAKLFPGARLAYNHHRRVIGGDAFDFFDHYGECRVGPYKLRYAQISRDVLANGFRLHWLPPKGFTGRLDSERIPRFPVPRLSAIILRAAVAPRRLMAQDSFEHGKAPAEAAGAQQWEERVRNLRSAFEEARYADAERECRAALQCAESFGYQDPRFISTLNDLGEIYRAQGRYSEAEPVLQQALALCRETPAGIHGVQVMNNLAALYAVQGKLGEAEKYYLSALQTAERLLAPDDGALGASLNNLALLYKMQNNYAAALPLFQRALRIWMKVLGPQHPLVATSLNNIGAICHAEGKLTEADSLFRQSLAIKEKALGPQHPEVATILNNLAEVCLDEHRFAEAKPLLQRLLALDEASLGPGHPELASDLSRLAFACEGMRDDAGAESLYRRALDIRERALGPKHEQVAKTLRKLSAVCEAQGRRKEAQEFATRADEIGEAEAQQQTGNRGQGTGNREQGTGVDRQVTQEEFAAAAPAAPQTSEISNAALPVQMLPPEGQTIEIPPLNEDQSVPAAAKSLVELADRYVREGRLAESEMLYEGALSIERALAGGINAPAGATASKLGLVLKSQGKNREAARMFQASLAVWLQLYGPDDAGVAASLNNLATVSTACPEARLLYERSVEVWRRITPAGDPRAQVAAANLAALPGTEAPSQ